jgi:phage portal protein BeeE
MVHNSDVTKTKRRRRPDVAQPAPPATLETHPAPMRDLFAGGILDTSTWASGSVTEAIALATDAVYGCVRIIADGVSSGEWGEWRGLERLPASRIVRRPMAALTRREWTWLVTATLGLYGYCPIRYVGGLDAEGVPWSLVPLSPARLSKIAGTNTYAYAGETIPADELRFIRRTLFPGASPESTGIIRLAQFAIEASYASGAYVADWWDAGGSPMTVISTDQELTKTQAEEIADRWIERRKLGPSHPAVLGKGAGAKGFGADPLAEDAAIAQDRIVATIARYYGVPAGLINAPSNSSLTYSTTESQGLDLVRYTLSGYADAIADFMSTVLPGDYLAGRTVRIDLSALTRAEQLARYQSWAIALDPAAPFMTRDEVRAYEGLAPMQELELAAPAASTPAPAPAPVVVVDEPEEVPA